MSSKQYETEARDRVPFAHKIIYGLGAFVNNLLAAASGGMMIVLNLGFGMNPALVGLLGALPRLFDALTDPIMGYISDNTRSRWGRRRPYIFAGAILSGLTFIALWQLPRGHSETFYFVYFLIGSLIFYSAYTIYATPWVALGYELTPDYNERTRLMGVQNFTGQLAYVASPWFLWLMTNENLFDDQIAGAAGLAVVIAIVTIAIGVLPALFLRERLAGSPVTGEAIVSGFVHNIKMFFKGFGLVLKSKPFLLLCAATFLVFNGFIMISSFSAYVIIYYVLGGDQEAGARYAGYAGTVGGVSTFAVVVLVTWLGTRIGKQRAFYLSTGISMVGYGLKWFCYDPAYPLLVILPAPLLAFGLGGLFTLMPSMVADVVDLDELTTHQRREGMFGSIFWWVVKLGMALALAGGGYLLNATGFDVDLKGGQAENTIFLLRMFDILVPMVCSGIAIWAVAKFPITAARAHEIRVILEHRRNDVTVDPRGEAMNKTDGKERVANLLAKMTLEQKLGQMIQSERLWTTPEEVKLHHLGSVLSGGGSVPGDNTPAAWVSMNDAYWAASMTEDEHHLAIPLLYGVDAIHGNNNVRGAVVFPHNIGLGAANDPELIERIAQVTAREVLATGVEWTFAPTLAVVRNDHWGRTYESYSEDPEIVGVYAERFVKGLQAGLGRDGVLATAKHWVGDGGTTGGVDQGNTVVSETELTRLHMAPYHGALRAGALTVMASYNSWNGDKCHGNHYLLTEVLKKRLEFRGLVVSDWNGTDQLSEDLGTAVARAVNAGIDMLMVPQRWKEILVELRRKVDDGTIPLDRIDDAVTRILMVKHWYGLFERPRPSERHWSNDKSFGSSAHREVAREAVRKSLVLLKNDAAILPLDRTKRLLVAGKNADNRGHLCGGFTIEWQGTSGNDRIEGGTSIWEGIRALAPEAVLSIDGAAAAEQPFDAAIVVIGERPYAEFMGDVREGDSSTLGSGVLRPTETNAPYAKTLELAISHPEDLATIRAITARGIPAIVVLVSGRPLVVNQELAEATAFVAAWLPGSEGQGVADVLFGDHKFQGKLSFSWPRTNDDNFNRGDAHYDPLFPYGFGLTYPEG